MSRLSFEECLTTELESAFAGLLAPNSVYPDSPPPKSSESLGYVLYQRQGDNNPTVLSGRESLRETTYQIEIWHTDRAKLEQARDIAFSRFGGAIGGRWGGNNGVWVFGAIASDTSADIEPITDGDIDPDRVERFTLKIIWK